MTMGSNWQRIPSGFRTEGEPHYRAAFTGTEVALFYVDGDTATRLGGFEDYPMAEHGAERHAAGLPAEFDYRARFDVDGWKALSALPDMSIANGGMDTYRADNQARATFAARALSAYVDRVGGDEFGTAVSDLLADLMHLCDGLGLEFEECLETATTRHGEELRGDV